MYRSLDFCVKLYNNGLGGLEPYSADVCETSTTTTTTTTTIAVLNLPAVKGILIAFVTEFISWSRCSDANTAYNPPENAAPG